MDSNALDLELVKSVGEYFRLNNEQIETIIEEVLKSVSQWKKVANKLGISRAEQVVMAAAFIDD